MKTWKTSYKDTDFVVCPYCLEWYPPNTELNQVHLEPRSERYKINLMCDKCLDRRTKESLDNIRRAY